MMFADIISQSNKGFISQSKGLQPLVVAVEAAASKVDVAVEAVAVAAVAEVAVAVAAAAEVANSIAATAVAEVANSIAAAAVVVEVAEAAAAEAAGAAAATMLYQNRSNPLDGWYPDAQIFFDLLSFFNLLPVYLAAMLDDGNVKMILSICAQFKYLE